MRRVCGVSLYCRGFGGRSGLEGRGPLGSDAIGLGRRIGGGVGRSRRGLLDLARVLRLRGAVGVRDSLGHGSLRGRGGPRRRDRRRSFRLQHEGGAEGNQSQGDGRGHDAGSASDAAPMRVLNAGAARSGGSSGRLGGRNWVAHDFHEHAQ